MNIFSRSISIVAVFCLSITAIHAQKNRIKFDKISFDKGLSQSSVASIVQDSRGFMWFATLDGLNKYDGYQIKEYRHQPDNPFSIADNPIKVIYEEAAQWGGAMWVGTESGGLSRYNKLTDNFTSFRHDANDATSVSSNQITAICTDATGVIWIGTDNGLNKFDRNTGKFERLFYKKDDNSSIPDNKIVQIIPASDGNLWIATKNGFAKLNVATSKCTVYKSETSGLSSNTVNTLFEDASGVLWIGTNNGLNIFEKNQFTVLTAKQGIDTSLSNNNVTAIIEDSDGKLWVGTAGGGLNMYDRKTGRFSVFKHDPTDPQSLSVDHILCIYRDRVDILWIGTSLGGINKWNRAAEELQVFRHNPYDPYSLSSSQVRSLYQDSKRDIWIGTVDGGLNKWDIEQNKFIHFRNIPNDPTSLSNNHVRCMLEDSKGNFWVGTGGGGLNKFDRATGKVKAYRKQDGNDNALRNDNVWKIAEDKQGYLWIATQGGLHKFDAKTEIFTAFTHDDKNPNSISDDRIVSLLVDKNGTLWVGTFEGLNRYDADKNSFTVYTHIKGDSTSLSNNRVYSLVEDKKGRLWVGTKGGCLNLFDPSTGKFRNFGQSYGFPNDAVMSMIEDNSGNLWISSNRGLSRFNTDNYDIRSFDARDGLQSNEFLIGSVCKAFDGELMFGGINGFNAFYPDEITDNPNKPEIVITSFKLFNKQYDLDTNITEKKYITLEHDQNFLSFDFVALDYIFPEKNQYAYKLENYEDEWNHVNDRRFANYTDLAPGKYVLRVKGSNNDGVWNEEGTAIVIDIIPAFWQTTWFQIAWISALILLVFAGVRYRLARIEAQKRKLEILVQQRTAEVVEQKKVIEKSRDEILLAKHEIEKSRDEILEQKKVIEESRDEIAHQRQEILDSIQYAKRIQTATLPAPDYGKKYVADSFVLFKPKDIVSGDFYWMGAVDDNLIGIAADCTGHGVPGAFMSMLGMSFLDKIIGELGVSQPHEILNQLRQNIINALHQTGKENEAKDGMDIALCTIDTKNNIVKFAGANNPLYMVRNGEVLVTKADKMPIAIYDDMSSFATQEIQAQKGDCVYIFSDGFCDQFGGPDGKKFMYKRFRDLLIEIAPKSMDEQRDLLNNAIETWRGEHEQVDDILLMGFRI